MTFTVTSNDYFDAPGSTIRFDIVKRGAGNYLDQTAKATGVDMLVADGVNVAGFQRISWNTQKENLIKAVMKYGEK